MRRIDCLYARQECSTTSTPNCSRRALSRHTRARIDIRSNNECAQHLSFASFRRLLYTDQSIRTRNSVIAMMIKGCGGALYLASPLLLEATAVKPLSRLIHDSQSKGKSLVGHSPGGFRQVIMLSRFRRMENRQEIAVTNAENPFGMLLGRGNMLLCSWAQDCCSHLTPDGLSPDKNCTARKRHGLHLLLARCNWRQGLLLHPCPPLRCDTTFRGTPASRVILHHYASIAHTAVGRPRRH